MRLIVIREMLHRTSSCTKAVLNLPCRRDNLFVEQFVDVSKDAPVLYATEERAEESESPREVHHENVL
jgi:hypothetical protein